MKKILTTFLLIICFCTIALAQQHDTITTASGLKYFFTKKGDGPAFKPGWLAIEHYILTLTDGTKIDDSRERGEPFSAQVPSGQTIKGFNEAILLMHVGDRGIFIMPASIGYGVKGNRTIPPNATLVFDMELLNMKEKSLEMVLDSVMFGKPMRPDSIPPHTAEAVNMFKQLKKEGFGNLYASENDLNDIGYRIIKKYPKDAVEILKLNVETYPKSGNAYDSLGEAYMDAGDYKLAIKNYQKSLALNPKNTNATDMINKMKATPVKP